ncbi:preprotein translocase subunit SecG [Pikeienuella piscinae]|uniref:Protein-export membrane protein SecG n=1 Tax=Pikeienuella piscinae TaxID=2748098 RepID=A0A7L5C380_9RHOB|nr:preprotein translocase subunit SecG [Pikeienuella piscinae]QIE56966.1 preprotein translocase subunit SecG [Pikeienuella piscinae]
MENIVLIVHLVIAAFLIGVVLLQRSEGGALGMGGGGGGLVSSRGAATALSKVTWALAAAFIATSLILTVISATSTGSRSVIEGVSTGVPEADDSGAPTSGGFSLPAQPTAPTETPTAPPAAD